MQEVPASFPGVFLIKQLIPNHVRTGDRKININFFKWCLRRRKEGLWREFQKVDICDGLIDYQGFSKMQDQKGAETLEGFGAGGDWRKVEGFENQDENLKMEALLTRDPEQVSRNMAKKRLECDGS